MFVVMGRIDPVGHSWKTGSTGDALGILATVEESGMSIGVSGGLLKKCPIGYWCRRIEGTIVAVVAWRSRGIVPGIWCA